jgi:hypothetical protein
MKFDMCSLIEIGKGFKSSKNERIQSIVHANINVFVKACYKSLNNLKIFTQSLKVKPLKKITIF